jgi:hypothetical protein
MFDFWRNLRKSKAEKEEELLHAYMDNALSPVERAQFEARLAQDDQLQAEVESLRQVKQMLSAVPRRPVPRNFTLDPAHYGRPVPQPLLQAYPVLRLVTVLTTIVFVIVLAFDWIVPGIGPAAPFAAEMLEEVALMERAIEEDVAEMEELAAIVEEEAPAAEPLAEPPVVEITRVVTEAVTAEIEERVDDETEVAMDDEDVTERATATATIAIPAAPEIVADEIETAVSPTVAREAEVTTVLPMEPDSRPISLTNRQWLQLGLGSLLALLLLLLFLARRQSSI